MNKVEAMYVGGRFQLPHGQAHSDLFNPATGACIGQVRLGDAQDADLAVAAAARAWPEFADTTVAQRIEGLRSLHQAVSAQVEAIAEATVLEYGAPLARARGMAQAGAHMFLDAAAVLQDYAFTRRMGTAQVSMEPLGVAALITPWNGNAMFVCAKLASALAAGCTAVVKPSELSALQTQALLQALHGAGLPAGVINVVNGRGDEVGAALCAHPQVAKVSFTGSTAVGRSILCAAAPSFKRVTLELGGKSPTVILDDADLAQAVTLALAAGFSNSGQACSAGTRILVPRTRLDDFLALLKPAVEATPVGDPRDPATVVGPLVSQTQWERVQRYIRRGLDEGARVLVGGEGRPDGLPAALQAGYFVKPTVFVEVDNAMTIAREEIFGPVLSVIAYEDEADAVRIANDTDYGLQAYVVSGGDGARARRVASRLRAGVVSINGLHHEPMAPFGGFKHSGLGRELGPFGLEAFLEPKTTLGG